MLALRLISALIGIPLLIGIIYLGGYVLAASLMLLIIFGTLEFQGFIKNLSGKSMIIPVFIGQFLFIAGIMLKWPFWSNVGLGITLLLILTLTVAQYPKYNFMDISINLFMLMYVGWALSHLLLLRELSQGFLLVAFLFLIIWSSDTGAYFAGRFFGKHKLAKVSPNKTLEGSLGGLVLSIFSALVFNSFFYIFSTTETIFLGIILSIAGQIGDLIESALKRLADVKDSGSLIPGHGGVLDRFDSTITTAPLLFYLIMILDKVG